MTCPVPAAHVRRQAPPPYRIAAWTYRRPYQACRQFPRPIRSPHEYLGSRQRRDAEAQSRHAENDPPRTRTGKYLGERPSRLNPRQTGAKNICARRAPGAHRDIRIAFERRITAPTRSGPVCLQCSSFSASSAYSSALSNASNSPALSIFTSNNQPSPNASSLMVSGLSASASFTPSTSPLIGA